MTTLRGILATELDALAGDHDPAAAGHDPLDRDRPRAWWSEWRADWSIAAQIGHWTAPSRVGSSNRAYPKLLTTLRNVRGSDACAISTLQQLLIRRPFRCDTTTSNALPLRITQICTGLSFFLESDNRQNK